MPRAVSVLMAVVLGAALAGCLQNYPVAGTVNGCRTDGGVASETQPGAEGAVPSIAHLVGPTGPIKGEPVLAWAGAVPKPFSFTARDAAANPCVLAMGLTDGDGNVTLRVLARSFAFVHPHTATENWTVEVSEPMSSGVRMTLELYPTELATGNSGDFFATAQQPYPPEWREGVFAPPSELQGDFEAPWLERLGSCSGTPAFRDVFVEWTNQATSGNLSMGLAWGGQAPFVSNSTAALARPLDGKHSVHLGPVVIPRGVDLMYVVGTQGPMVPPALPLHFSVTAVATLHGPFDRAPC